MLISTAQLLQQARQNHYAVGAFNDYTLEGVRAVVSAAEEANSLTISMGKSVNAELGRLEGTEDGMTVALREARLTDPAQAEAFVEETGVHALAVCIGNLHGTDHTPPDLDFERLAAITDRASVPLLLHGTSGLPDDMITRAVTLGVSIFNVNTELHDAGIAAGGMYMLVTEKPEIVDRMQAEIDAMRHPVISKIVLFGSTGQAP